jgi:hypothetical protein
MEMGRLVFIYTAVLNASREAARYGAATGTNDAGTKLYNDCDGIIAAATRVGFLANIKASDVTIRYDNGSGNPDATIDNGSSQDCPPGTITGGDRIVVKVAVPFSPIVPLVPLRQFWVTSTNARTIIGSVAIKGDVPPPPVPPGVPNFTSIDTVPTSLPYIVGGPTGGGTTVKITGTDLDKLFPGGTFTFDGVNTPCTLVSSTEITCTTTGGHTNSPTPVDVVGTLGANTTSLIASYTFVDPPTINVGGIAPIYGPSGGGTTVVISGTNLTTRRTVKFGGVPTTTDCDVISDSQISCITPPHARGPVNIVITTASDVQATASNAFTYLDLPQITGISPASVLTTGSYVTINGLYFTGMTDVTLDGISIMPSCTVYADNNIGCTFPVHAAGPATIIVTTPGGTSAPYSFNYVDATITPTWLYSPTPSETATITATATETLTPTLTITAKPTLTSTASLTLTPKPTLTTTPTVTKTPIPCVSLSSLIPDGSTNTATIYMTNNIGADITLTGSYLIWNDNNGSGNGNLSNIKVEPFGTADIIMSGTGISSPNTTTSWSGAASLRTIINTQTKGLRFTFARDAIASGYYLELTFSNGCKVNTGIGITATSTP